MKEHRKLVVHCKKAKYDVHIGRPSKWGNPFKVGVHGARGECVKLYADWIKTQPELIEQAKAELRGKTLGCWCSPSACHGWVLAYYANA